MVMTDAMAANTATGANIITAPVIFSMMCTRSSIQATRVFAFSPRLAAATPKKIENTTICRISLAAIASMTLRGTRCATNSLSESDPVLRLVDAAASGSGRFRPTPGCMTFTSSRPSRSDTSEAEMNQPSAFRPTRPTDLVSPMWAMPTTRVENTSGAMIILMSRRKISVSSET